MSNTITIKSRTVNLAAIKAGTTAEKFVAQVRSISLGRKVCAHLLKTEGGMSVFICE